MKARPFLAVLLAALLTLVGLGIGGWWWIWLSSPLQLQRQVATVPRAARFVPRHADLALYVLSDGERPVAYARAVAPLSKRQQAGEAISRLRDGAFAAAGLDYDAELASWLAAPMALALFHPPASAGGPAEPAAGWLLALGSGDDGGARRFLQRFWQSRSLAGTDLQVSRYRGMGLISGRGALGGRQPLPLATALIDDDLVLIASGRDVIEEALDVSQIAALNQAGLAELQRAPQRFGSAAALLVAGPEALERWLGLPDAAAGPWLEPGDDPTPQGRSVADGASTPGSTSPGPTAPTPAPPTPRQPSGNQASGSTVVEGAAAAEASPPSGALLPGVPAAGPLEAAPDGSRRPLPLPSEVRRDGPASDPREVGAESPSPLPAATQRAAAEPPAAERPIAAPGEVAGDGSDPAQAQRPQGAAPLAGATAPVGRSAGSPQRPEESPTGTAAADGTRLQSAELPAPAASPRSAGLASTSARNDASAPSRPAAAAAPPPPAPASAAGSSAVATSAHSLEAGEPSEESAGSAAARALPAESAPAAASAAAEPPAADASQTDAPTGFAQGLSARLSSGLSRGLSKVTGSLPSPPRQAPGASTPPLMAPTSGGPDEVVGEPPEPVEAAQPAGASRNGPSRGPARLAVWAGTPAWAAESSTVPGRDPGEGRQREGQPKGQPKGLGVSSGRLGEGAGGAQGRLVLALRPEGTTLLMQADLALNDPWTVFSSNAESPAAGPVAGDPQLEGLLAGLRGDLDSLAVLRNPAAWRRLLPLRPMLSRILGGRLSGPLPALVAANDDGLLVAADGPRGWQLGSDADHPPLRSLEAPLAAAGLIAAPLQQGDRSLLVWTRLQVAGGRPVRRGGDGADQLQASLAGWWTREGALAWWGRSLSQLQDGPAPAARRQQLAALPQPDAGFQWAMAGPVARDLLSSWQPWRLLNALAGGGIDDSIAGLALAIDPKPGGLAVQARLELG